MNLSKPSVAALRDARVLVRNSVGSTRTAVNTKVQAVLPLPPVVSATGKMMYRPFHGLNGQPKYLEAYVPEHPAADSRCGWVALHRLVVESKLGRFLNKGERVLFRDGDGFNCSPANVYVAAEAQS